MAGGYPADPETGLTERETQFVREYVTCGGKKEKSAIAAGYSENGARTRAWELLRKPKITLAVSQFRRALYQHDATKARKVLSDMMMDENVSDSVKKDIALAFIDRAGDKHAQVIEIADHRTPEEIQNKLEMLLGGDTDEKEPVLN